MNKMQIMGSIETIEVRLSSKLSPILENAIAEIVEKASSEEEVSAVRLYHKVRMKSDYLIILVYRKQYTEIHSKALGEILKKTLREYGMVYQNHWNEIM